MSANSNKANPNRVGVLVLGMHRCGTSAVTRTLNLLGAALPSDLMPATAENQTGFWESGSIMQTHDRFLQAIGSDWCDPLPLADSAFSTPAARTCHDHLLAILHRDFATAPLFAIKDPRCCRLLPLWRKVLESFSAHPLAVLTVRNPLEAALSLRLRNQMPREQALALWLIHALEAELMSRDWGRAFIHYDDFITAPAHAAKILVERMGCFPTENLTSALPHITEFWSEGLRHHHLPAMTMEDASIPLWIRQSYDWFARAAAGQAPNSAILDRMAAELERAIQIYGPLTAPQKGADPIVREREQSEARADFNAQMRETREELARLSGRESVTGELLAQIRSERDNLIARLSASENALKQTQTVKDELAARLKDAQSVLAKQEHSRHALLHQMDALTDQLRRTDEAVQILASVATDIHGQIPQSRRFGGLVRAALRGQLRQRLAEDRDIETISRSGLFDVAYYLRRYPDVAITRIDPIIHYVRCGAREGRDPHPAFDTRFYLRNAPDLARLAVNPLAHYARHGVAEGRLPNGAARKGGRTELNPLLVARLRAEGTSQQHLAPLSVPPSAPEPPLLAEGSFSWLSPAERDALNHLFSDHGLGTHGNTAKRDQDFALRRVATAFAALPSGPPRISIVIPVHNQFRHTLACLDSLSRWPTRCPMEVLIGDDASTDGTARNLSGIPHLRVVRSEIAEGFLANCNRTATHAQGDFILLLNNDTVVLPGAVDALIDTFATHPDCGLAGCRLVYPDGRLQEAGGIIWADGSGWNFGRLDDPELAEYTYLRDADYCSGAAIAIPTTFWRELGGFDNRYQPAYYEDTDLAYRVREAGRRVLYQPAATIIHFEGISNGTDEDRGIKRFQRQNLPKFLARWQKAIAANGMPSSQPPNVAERSRRGRILVLDACTPTPDCDSGSIDTVIMLDTLRTQGWHVTFLTQNLTHEGPYTRQLEQRGILCLRGPGLADFKTEATRLAPHFDAIVVSRVPVARQVMSALKKAAPRTKLIFNTVDLHFLREAREAELFADPAMVRRAKDTRRAELAVIEAADATLVVSSFEQDMLAELTPGARVRTMPLRRVVPSGPFPPFQDRNGVIFVGGFRHSPNQDAVTWFLAEIWPLVRRMGLEVPLYIVGPDAPPFLVDDPALDVHVLGHVPDLAAIFARCRISVAPIRYGAGLKGKVVDSLCHGLPVVATPVATEGSGLEHGQHLIVSQTAEDFARAVIELHNSQDLWNRLAATGSAYARRSFSAQTAAQVLTDLFRELDLLATAPETDNAA